MDIINKIINIIEILFCYIFYGAIIFFSIRYIVKSLCFINPITKKYNIMTGNPKTNIIGRNFICLFNFVVITLSTYASFLSINNLIYYELIAYIIISLYFILKFRKYTIVDYVAEFSEDVLDWNRIYNLDIDEEIKKKCFAIHSISYNDFADNQKILKKMLEI